MKKIFNILATAVALVSIASCNLDLKPEGSIVYDPDNLISFASDLQGLEADVLAQLRGLEYGIYDEASDVMVDYFNATIDYGNNLGSIHRTDNTFTAGDYDSEDNWQNMFYAIKNFNIVIDGCTVDALPEDLKADAEMVALAHQARGEAYFARAYVYLHMARIFGKPVATASDSDLAVPVVLHYDQNAMPARATVSEVYEQIKADLDSAYALLKNVPGAARAERPTVDAVNALYARYYLDKADYANAAAKAVEVINTGNYALADDAATFAAEFNDDNGTEPILQFYASLAEGGSARHEYICPTETADNTYGPYYQPYFLPCKTLVEAYEASDLRLANWFSINQNYTELNGSFMNDQFYVFLKYPGNMALTSGNVHTTAHAVKPLLISEMYLIAAEAYALSGSTGDAATQLNVLQAKRGATPTSGAIANVKAEWYKETVGEGLRMSCLKRWGEGFSGRPAQAGAVGFLMSGPDYEGKSMPASDYHWQWPVPTYEIQVNPNLVQNEGYVSTSEN